MNKLTVETAFARLFSGKQLDYDIKVRFSRKFGAYNANVKKQNQLLVFSFSPEWKRVSKEITIGLVQELLLRILRKKAKTTNIDLYNNFVKNLHLSASKTETDPALKEIFDVVNTRYFHSVMEMPNLKWGLTSKTKLATYDYHTDTINVSTIFQSAGKQIISYLVYHEMLHKKLKFHNNGSRSVHHSRQFRQMEKEFENQQEVERLLERFLRKNRGFKGWLGNLL